MKNDTTCPYCGYDVEINHDDGQGYEEGTLHRQDCKNCEMTFTFETTISFSYESYTADCLNGGEHDYRKTNTHPVKFARLRCRNCDHEKALPANEHDTAEQAILP